MKPIKFIQHTFFFIVTEGTAETKPLIQYLLQQEASIHWSQGQYEVGGGNGIGSQSKIVRIRLWAFLGTSSHYLAER